MLIAINLLQTSSRPWMIVIKKPKNSDADGINGICLTLDRQKTTT
jgi:hypothetical protein